MECEITTLTASHRASPCREQSRNPVKYLSSHVNAFYQTHLFHSLRSRLKDQKSLGSHLLSPFKSFVLLPAYIPMRSFSLFLLRNSVSAKMKKSLRSFCNGVGSTSTLNQRRPDQEFSCLVDPSSLGSSYSPDGRLEEGRPSTLEEMIWQLELEEEAARRAELGEHANRRMSCVNNSDILRSARNALNQYPRFSLDGRDAMYRSSFRNLCYEEGRRKSVCCPGGRRTTMFRKDGYINLHPDLPTTLAGEKVVWCKPGVVAKLMGLDAMPIPVRDKLTKTKERAVNCRTKRESEMRRFESRELDKTKKRIAMGMHGLSDPRESIRGGGAQRRRSNAGNCAKERIRME